MVCWRYDISPPRQITRGCWVRKYDNSVLLSRHLRRISQAPKCYRVCNLAARSNTRSEEHTSELQSRLQLVCRLQLEKKNVLTGLLHMATTFPEFRDSKAWLERV